MRRAGGSHTESSITPVALTPTGSAALQGVGTAQATAGLSDGYGEESIPDSNCPAEAQEIQK